ncbi:MAG: HlyD family efflux transporter periplasmic adaptor subunit [Chloroflexi bacterium]|nr:HlyD family efflux transporter periplasmic adaptor subunit [Chloroflexota bacterium]
MKTKRRNRRSAGSGWLGGVGCLVMLAALVVGGYFVYQRIKAGFSGPDYSGPPMATEDVAVTRGDVTEAVSLWGQIQAIRSQTLAFYTAGGRILSVEASVGMPVTAGQVLVSLDVPALERTVTEAKAELNAAEAELEALTEQDPMRRYELELQLTNARAALAEAQLALQEFDAGRGTPLEKRTAAAETATEARRELNELVNGKEYTERLAQLQYIYNVSEVEHGVYTLIQNPSEEDRDREWLLRIDMLDKQQALDSYKHAHAVAVRMARQKVAEAERDLAALDRQIAKGSAEIARAALQVAVQSAEVRLAEVQQALADLGGEVDPVELAKAQAKVLKLEGKLKDAEAALGDAQLVAPFDGTVLDVRAIPQAMASTGAPMVTLADTSAYVVLANLGELDVARVREGQEVALLFDAFGPEAKLVGRLGEIPRYGRLENGVTVFPVKISIDEMTLPVFEGMGATVSVPLGVRENVLTVPAAAVDYWPEATYVNVVVDGEVEQREVVLGVGDGINVEVLEGLSEGEIVRMRLVGNQVYG